MEDSGQRSGLAPAGGIHLMENHDEAYRVWSRMGVRDRVLVHIDAHDDVVWAADDAAINIASFICPAIKEGMVREVFWVVPDETWATPKRIRCVMQRLKRVMKRYPGKQLPPTLGKNQISLSILGKPVRVCPLGLLPPLGEAVLLDIDVDYLVIPQACQGSDQHTAIPWRWPDDLVAQLQAAGLSSDLITIAYSVEGGYTPLKWKYLGDELALRLDGGNQHQPEIRGLELIRQAFLAVHRGDEPGAEELYLEARELLPQCAAPAFHLANLYAERGEEQKAQEFYQEALARDASYRTPYNNAGIEYYYQGRFPEAAREYQRTLRMEPQDPYAHLGLGKIAARRKNWQEAETWCHKSLTLNANIVDTHRLLGKVLSRQGRRQEAIAAYERSLQLTLAGQKPLKAPILSNAEVHPLLDPDHARIHLLLARLYAREGMVDTAIVAYRMGIALGGDRFLPHWQLACLYGKTRQWQRSCREVVLAIAKMPIGLKISYMSHRQWIEYWIRRKVEAFSR
jgi:tetratricopeptide (TPR) repeat protein